MGPSRSRPASVRPSGMNMRQARIRLPLEYTPCISPLAVDHTRMAPSEQSVAMSDASGDKQTASTWLGCSRVIELGGSTPRFHTRVVLSIEPHAIVRLSAEKAIEEIWFF